MGRRRTLDQPSKPRRATDFCMDIAFITISKYRAYLLTKQKEVRHMTIWEGGVELYFNMQSFMKALLEKTSR